MFAGGQVARGAEVGVPVPAAADGAVATTAGRAALDLLAAVREAPVRLRMERKFNVLAPKPKSDLPPLPALGPGAAPADPGKDAHPVFLVADQIFGQNEAETVAEGAAELRKFGTLVLADKLTYWPLADEVEARGTVRLQQGWDEVSGPHMRMKLSEQIGFFEEPVFKFRKEVINRFYRPVSSVTTNVNTTTTTSGAPLMLSVPRGYGLPVEAPPRRPSESYGRARRMDFEGENQVRLTDGEYSTCKPERTDWYVHADEMKLDYDREVADVTNASLRFKELPLFFTPVGSFSLNHQRKSGLLPPNFAASSKNGFDLTLPFYWNLAPNYDATFYPREMSKRGEQLGFEARYADLLYSGSTKLEYLSNDKVADRSRYAFGVGHTHDLGRGLVAKINWNGVSDDRYWQDFSSRLLQTSQTQLPRQLQLSYSPGSWWSASLQTLRYQTLQPDPKTPIDRPYFIEPQINVGGRLMSDQYRTEFSFLGQYTSFSHPSMVEGARTVVYPQISLPYIDPAFVIVPKIGVHATHYSLDHQAAGTPSAISRVLPTLTLDGTLLFERDTRILDLDYIQTLEPRLYYVYIPYRDQGKIPVFDSGISDFNFAQIFTENRYSGYDRVNDANQLTAVATTRFLDAGTGAERFKAAIGQRYYFDQQKVVFPGETQRAKSFSNLIAAFNGLVLPKTYVDAAWEYNYHKSQNERLSIGARYQPDFARVASASFRQTRDALGSGQVEQIDLAGQWPLTSKLYAVGRYNYSLRDKQALETIAGLEYNAGCWAARFVVQRLEAISGSSNTTFFFQLELSDFASVGSNPIQLLRRTIPGYGKVNEMPTTGSLLTSQ